MLPIAKRSACQEGQGGNKTENLSDLMTKHKSERNCALNHLVCTAHCIFIIPIGGLLSNAAVSEIFVAFLSTLSSERLQKFKEDTEGKKIK